MKKALLMSLVAALGVLTLAVNCNPPSDGVTPPIVGTWETNDTYVFYNPYPSSVDQTLINTMTLAADGTFTQEGSAGGQTMKGSGTYDYDEVAETVDMTYETWEMPIGTPAAVPVVPTSDCVIDGDTMTMTAPTPADGEYG